MKTLIRGFVLVVLAYVVLVGAGRLLQTERGTLIVVAGGFALIRRGSFARRPARRRAFPARAAIPATLAHWRAREARLLAAGSATDR